MDIFLPSEIGRLVLGYLKEEGCMKTYTEFMRECVHIAEYAAYYRRGQEFPTMIGRKSLKQIINEYGQLVLYKQELKSDSLDILWLKHDVTVGHIKSQCTPANVQVPMAAGGSAPQTQSQRMRCTQRPTPSTRMPQTQKKSPSSPQPVRRALILNSSPSQTVERGDAMEASPPASPISQEHTDGGNDAFSTNYESDSDALVVETDAGSACGTPVKSSCKSPSSQTSSSTVIHRLSPTVFDSTCARDVISNRVAERPSPKDSSESSEIKEKSNDESKQRPSDKTESSPSDSTQGNDNRYTNHQRKRVGFLVDEVQEEDKIEPDDPKQEDVFSTPRKCQDNVESKLSQLGKSPRRKRPIPKRRSVETPAVPTPAAPVPSSSTEEPLRDPMPSMPSIDDFIFYPKFAETIAGSINRINKVTETGGTRSSSSQPQNATADQSVEINGKIASVDEAQTNKPEPAPTSSKKASEDTSQLSEDAEPDVALENVLQIRESAMTEEAMKDIMELTKTDPSFDALLQMFNVDKNENLYQDLEQPAKKEETPFSEDKQPEEDTAEIPASESVQPSKRSKRTVLKVREIDEKEASAGNIRTAKVLIPSSDNGPPIIQNIQIEMSPKALPKQRERAGKKGSRVRSRCQKSPSLDQNESDDASDVSTEDVQSRRVTRSSSRVKSVKAKSAKGKSAKAKPPKSPEKEASVQETSVQNTSINSDSNGAVFKVPEVPRLSVSKSPGNALKTLNTSSLGLVCTASDIPEDPPVTPPSKPPGLTKESRGGSRKKKQKSLGVGKKRNNPVPSPEPSETSLNSPRLPNYASPTGTYNSGVPNANLYSLPSMNQYVVSSGMINSPMTVSSDAVQVYNNNMPASIGQGPLAPTAITSNSFLGTDLITAFSIYTRGECTTTQAAPIYQQSDSQFRTNAYVEAQQIYTQMQGIPEGNQQYASYAWPQSQSSGSMGGNQHNISNVNALSVAGATSSYVTSQTIFESVQPYPMVESLQANNALPVSSVSAGSETTASCIEQNIQTQTSEVNLIPQSNMLQTNSNPVPGGNINTESKNTVEEPLPTNTVTDNGPEVTPETLDKEPEPGVDETHTETLNVEDNSANDTNADEIANTACNQTKEHEQSTTVLCTASVELGTPILSIPETTLQSQPYGGRTECTAIHDQQPSSINSPMVTNSGKEPSVSETDAATAVLEGLNSSVRSSSSPFYSNPMTPSLGAQETIGSSSPFAVSPSSALAPSLTNSDFVTPQRSKPPVACRGSARTSCPYPKYKLLPKYTPKIMSPLAREELASPAKRKTKEEVSERRDEAPCTKSPDKGETDSPPSDKATDENTTPEKDPKGGGGTPLATREAQAVDTLMTLSLTPVKTAMGVALTHLAPANPKIPMKADENENNKKASSIDCSNSVSKESVSTEQTAVLKTPTKRKAPATPVSPVRSSKLSKLIEASSAFLINGDSSKDSKKDGKKKGLKHKSSGESKKPGLDDSAIEKILAKLHPKK